VPERAKNETLRFGGAVASRAFRKDERDGHETDDVAETQLWPEPGPKLEDECRENTADIAGAMAFSACFWNVALTCWVVAAAGEIVQRM
jgi:hypothetical protein